MRNEINSIRLFGLAKMKGHHFYSWSVKSLCSEDEHVSLSSAKTSETYS